MRAATFVLLASTLLAPLASAQFLEARSAIDMSPLPHGAQLRIDAPGAEHMEPGWVLVGHDNVLNLTLRNFRPEPLSATFRINASGATVTPDNVTLRVGPQGTASALLALRPDDAGVVRVNAEAIDAFEPGGNPVTALWESTALALPSVRFLDPPPTPPEDDEFQRIDMFGMTGGGAITARVRPGETLRPRIEVHNPLATAIPPTRLALLGPSEAIGRVEVPALDAGQTRTLELPEFVAPDERGGGFHGFHPSARYELRVVAETPVGGVTRNSLVSEYDIKNGAVQVLTVGHILVLVQDGLAIDLTIPRQPVLGVPTRVTFNVSNHGATPLTGTVVLTLVTPGGLFYEVQGPETHPVHVDLGPGMSRSHAIEFTPRVTGNWQVQTVFRSSEGFGYGGGGGIIPVAGPVTIEKSHSSTTYARIGERIPVELVIETTQTLQGAELRVASGGGHGFGDPSQASGASYRPGLSERLVRVDQLGGSLATLRPEGAVNITLELVARSAGRYSVVPYVLAEGFAYTSTARAEPSHPGGPMFSPGGDAAVQLAVQPRPVPAAMALAPLTIGLGVFVGVWTLRTRFVR